ncbi:MAG: HU family DNA-binding protein [Solobacterium sp.]|nr:HU family DNA-binding protein [Solobacterium sp.]
MMKVSNVESMAEILSERHNLTKKESNEIIVLIFDLISQSLSEGDTVDIKKFGKFSVKERPARLGINPKTLEKIQIPDRKVLVFKPSSTLKNKIG